MVATLAELRAKPTKARAERKETICTNPEIVARVVELTAKLTSIKLPPAAAGGGGEDGEGPPKKLARQAAVDQAGVRVELAAALAEMEAAEGDLILRATDDGEWRRWVDEHPSRKEGEVGYQRDQEVTFGYCNADDLIDDLATYAYTWEGDRLADGDWALLAENVALPDKKRLAQSVTSMFESRLDFQGWRQSLQETLSALGVSASPATSASAPADS